MALDRQTDLQIRSTGKTESCCNGLQMSLETQAWGMRRECGWSWVGDYPDEFPNCLCPFALPFPLPSRSLLSENRIYLAWKELGKPGTERSTEGEVPTVKKPVKGSVGGQASSKRECKKTVFSLVGNPGNIVTKHNSVERNPCEMWPTRLSCDTVQKTQHDLCYSGEIRITRIFGFKLHAVVAVNFCPGYQDCNIYRHAWHRGW